MRATVVGHVEWAHFVEGTTPPTPGEIVHSLDGIDLPAVGRAGRARPR